MELSRRPTRTNESSEDEMLWQEGPSTSASSSIKPDAFKSIPGLGGVDARKVYGGDGGSREPFSYRERRQEEQDAEEVR